jgi:hypothetical protein
LVSEKGMDHLIVSKFVGETIPVHSVKSMLDTLKSSADYARIVREVAVEIKKEIGGDIDELECQDAEEDDALNDDTLNR